MAKPTVKTLVEAVQAVFDALEPFDDGARNRILQSATSLLGGTVAQPSTPVSAPTIGGGTPGRAATERPLSPVELIQDKKPSTNSQRIALFAYYRERSEGLSRFGKEDLRAYFAKAKQPPPQNYDRDFRQAVQAGWIYEDGLDSYLTSKGLEAVEAGFEGKSAPRATSSRKKKPTSKKKKR
jgi:hypothetical protein